MITNEVQYRATKAHLERFELVPCQATFARLTSARSAWSWACWLRQRM